MPYSILSPSGRIGSSMLALVASFAHLGNVSAYALTCLIIGVNVGMKHNDHVGMKLVV